MDNMETLIITVMQIILIQINGFTPQPIIAPKKVCTTFQNQYVEQPIICPIECRRVNNIVYVPRYYPRYEQTCYTQTNRY